MKQQFKISIAKPCNENWADFNKTTTGGYCASCKKDVIDFTKLNDAQIIDILKSSSSTCARLNTHQINRQYQILTKSSTSFKWPGLKPVLAGLSILIAGTNSYADKPKAITETIQSETGFEEEKPVDIKPKKRTISGTVLDEYGETLPGASINLKGTSIGTITDRNGHFELSFEMEDGDVIVFSYIGLITQEYKIRKGEPDKMEIQMVLDEYVLMGELSIEKVYGAETSSPSLWSKIRRLF